MQALQDRMIELASKKQKLEAKARVTVVDVDEQASVEPVVVHTKDQPQYYRGTPVNTDRPIRSVGYMPYPHHPPKAVAEGNRAVTDALSENPRGTAGSKTAGAKGRRADADGLIEILHGGGGKGKGADTDALIENLHPAAASGSDD